MIRVKTKKGGNWVVKGGKEGNYEENCKRRDNKLTIKLICLVIMTLLFVAMKIALFVMIGKFVFQEENNLFGFPVKMFSFTKTYWTSHQPLERNSTENKIK